MDGHEHRGVLHVGLVLVRMMDDVTVMRTEGDTHGDVPSTRAVLTL